MTVRVGIIGTGFARRVQLPGLRLAPEVRVTAVASGRPENAEATAREFAIPHVCADGPELTRSADVDLVLVSSTPDTHARYAIAALEAGKHVLCEKPTALDAREAAAMLAVAERRPGQLSWMDHELRYEPNRRRVRELIVQGAIVVAAQEGLGGTDPDRAEPPGDVVDEVGQRLRNRGAGRRRDEGVRAAAMTLCGAGKSRRPTPRRRR